MSERSPLLSSSEAPDSEPSQTAINLDDIVPQAKTSLLRGLVISIAVFVLIFILTFGVSIITTIQSSIARDLQVTSSTSWFTSAYLIAGTSVTPIAGKICEIFSPRSYLLTCTAIQVIGLLVIAFAKSFGIFLVGRVICGVGAAGITPVAFILVTKLASRQRWGLYFGLINGAYTAGIATGAVVGGALEPLVGWRAVFWMQSPVCIVAGTAAFWAIPSDSDAFAHSEHEKATISQRLAKVDFLGLITLVAAVVLLLYSLSMPRIPIVPLVVSAALFALFVLIESRWTVDPIIPPVILRSRAMFLTGISTIGFMSARWEVLFYTPTYAIAVRGWPASKAGGLLVPTNLGFATGSLVIGALHVRRPGSYYLPCLICYVAFILEHFALSRLMISTSPVWLLAAGLFVNGFIAGAMLTYNLPHLLYLTRKNHHVIVLPLITMYRSLSGSIGSSLTGGLFTRSLQRSLSEGFDRRGLYGRGELILQLLGRPMLVQKLQGAEREAAEESYARSIQYLFVVGSILVIAMMVLQAGVGWTSPELEPQDKLEDAHPDSQETEEGNEQRAN